MIEKLLPLVDGNLPWFQLLLASLVAPLQPPLELLALFQR